MKLSEISDKEILEIVKPLAEHTENSWNIKDYRGFCRYLYIENTDRDFTENDFNRQIDESYDEFGYHTIADLVAIHRNPDNVIVLWKVRFQNRPNPGLLMYEFKEYEGRVLIPACSYHA